MRRNAFIVPILGLLLLGAFQSCTVDNNDSSSETTSDCAITNVVMGTLYRTINTTTASGVDTTYSSTVVGSLYPMYIDESRREIYNPDSLPINTHIDRVVLSTLTCDGTAAYRSLSSGNDTVFSSTDSLDFTQPRRFTVYASDGTKRSYQIHVNCHKVKSEAFTWTKMNSAEVDFQALTSPRAFVVNGTIQVFGITNNTPVMLSSATSNGATWTKSEISLTGLQTKSIQRAGNTYYALTPNGLYSSEDGITWSTKQSTIQPDALVGGGSKTLYAMKGGKLYSSTDGQTWTEESLDENSDLLPTSNYANTCFTSTTNGNIEYLLVGGYNNGTTQLWKKENDLTGKEATPWNYCPIGEDNPYPCPTLNNLSFTYYDKCVLATGFDNNKMSAFYVSKDGGRTWKKDTSVYTLPGTMATPADYACIVDGNNYLWVFGCGTGEVWRGRINRLSFEANQTIFTK